MSLPWIQVTTNLRNHPKSMRLGVKLKDSRAYLYLVDLWIWAGEACPGGELLGEDAEAVIEQVIGWTGEPGAFVDAAAEVGFLDRLNLESGGLGIHDWEEHNAAHFRKQQRDRERYARVREHSATLPRRKRDASATTPPVRGDKEERRGETAHAGGAPAPVAADPPAAPPAPKAPDPVAQLVALWNQITGPAGLPAWGDAKGRAKHAKERLKEHPDLLWWATVIDRIVASDFCRGLGPRGWKASPDFLVERDSAVKVLEGKYDNPTLHPRPKPAAPVGGIPTSTAPLESNACGDCGTERGTSRIPGLGWLCWPCEVKRRPPEASP